MNSVCDYTITTDDFSQIRENFTPALRNHLILSDATETGADSAIACASMFANFFSAITNHPDWTEDWTLYRGYLIDAYTT